MSVATLVDPDGRNQTIPIVRAALREISAGCFRSSTWEASRSHKRRRNWAIRRPSRQHRRRMGDAQDRCRVCVIRGMRTRRLRLSGEISPRRWKTSHAAEGFNKQRFSKLIKDKVTCQSCTSNFGTILCTAGRKATLSVKKSWSKEGATVVVVQSY